MLAEMATISITIPSWLLLVGYLVLKFGVAVYLQPYHLRATEGTLEYHPTRLFIRSFLFEVEATLMKIIFLPPAALCLFLIYRDWSIFNIWKAIIPSVLSVKPSEFGSQNRLD